MDSYRTAFGVVYNWSRLREEMVEITGCDVELESLYSKERHNILTVNKDGKVVENGNTGIKLVRIVKDDKVTSERVYMLFVKYGNFPYLGVKIETLERLKYFVRNNAHKLNSNAGLLRILGTLGISCKDIENLDLTSLEYKGEGILRDRVHNIFIAELLNEDICNTICERLWEKERWEENNFKFLKNYIRLLLCKMDNESKKEGSLHGNGYILSADGENRVVNTGLLSKEGNFIYLLEIGFRSNQRKIEVLENKSILKGFGFSGKLPDCVKFYKKREELYFDTDKFHVEDIDRKTWKHIVEERRFRFPEKYKSFCYEEMVRLIREGLKFSLNVYKMDYRIILPMYSFEKKEIAYLIPIYLDKEFKKENIVFGLIAKNGCSYTIRTVLTPEQAYLNARLVCKI